MQLDSKMWEYTLLLSFVSSNMTLIKLLSYTEMS